MNVGKVHQIIGPVVDVTFSKGKLPEIYNAVIVKAGLDKNGEPTTYEKRDYQNRSYPGGCTASRGRSCSLCCNEFY